MGLIRRAESSVERAVEAPRRSAPENATPRRKNRGPALRVQPKELIQKLAKEMEAHKVVHRGVASIDNRFTVYLCPDDYDHYVGRMDDLLQKLERGLARHVRSRRYEPAGDLEVGVVREPDLRPGYFGISAERATLGRTAPRGEAGEPQRLQTAFAARSDTAGPAPAHGLPGRGTKVIPPAEAAQLGLASHRIVLRTGDRVREFDQSRVILGRARDVDFRIDDPNVSRRHAAIFWDDGEVIVEDLHSTNGTMVNGYPISRTVLGPRDTLVIGDSRIVVEAKSG